MLDTVKEMAHKHFQGARMQTREGLRLAHGRHAFREEFFKRFIEEIEGKR